MNILLEKIKIYFKKIKDFQIFLFKKRISDLKLYLKFNNIEFLHLA